VLAAAALFAINGSVSKLVLETGLSAPRLTQLRCTGAFVIVLGLCLTRGPGRLKVTRKELPALIALGLCGYSAVQWLYFVGISRLPVGVALLFEFTAPVVVAIWARFGMRRPVRRRVWPALGLALGGLALVAQLWDGLRLDLIGVLAGFGAAVALAAYYLLGERVVAGRDPLSLTCWGFGVASVFWAVALPWWTFPWRALGSTVAVGGHEVGVWILGGWIIVGGALVPYLLISAALRLITATEASIAGMAEPVLAGAVAWVWLGEVLSAIQLLGAVVVLTGIGLAQTARPHRQSDPMDITPG
jgi:drug/metabolite transporter (DMT)-like permease